jgi:acetyl-CoA acetyltransferase
MNANDTAIVGIAVTPFGKHIDLSLKALGGQAIDAALADAGLEKSDIDMAFVANSMAAVVTGQVSVIGQSVLRAQGFTGIPVFNIDNACASSSSALTLAVQAILSRAAETVLVLGVEKLMSSDRTKAYIALNGAADPDFVAAAGIDVTKESIFVSAIYPGRLKSYGDAYGLRAETLAQISVKNRANAGANPMAQYRDPITIDDVLKSRQIVGPITALMCAPIGDGASAVVLTRKERITKSQRPVWVRASAVGMGGTPGVSAIRKVAMRAYEQAGIAPADVDVAEVHDSIAFNEMLAYEELGFCELGQGATLVESGATTLHGRLPVNPSGGLESRGHPVAATGLAQIGELVTQLRGEAKGRQVPKARIALAENAGGCSLDDTAAIAVTILGA